MWFNLIIGVFLLPWTVGSCGQNVFPYFGYNTMRKEKKANVDVRKLARLIGIYSYVNGGIFILMAILQAVGLKISMMPAFIFLMISSFALAVMSQRYDYNVFDQRGRLRKGAGKKIIIIIAVMVITFVAVAVLMFFSAQDTKVSFLDEGLKIHGMYGDVYPWETIGKVELMESLPAIELRTNGSALGSTLKGHFRTTELGL